MGSLVDSPHDKIPDLAMALLLAQFSKGHPHSSLREKGAEQGNDQDHLLRLIQFCDESDARPLNVRLDEKQCLCHLLEPFTASEWRRDNRPLRPWPWPYFQMEQLHFQKKPAAIQY